MTEIIQSASEEWSQGWNIVVSSLVGIALCLSPLPFYTLIVLAPELAKTFGWSQSQVMGGFTCMTIGLLVGAPFVGHLTDKLGARRVLLPSIILLGLGMMAFSLMNGNIWIFYGIFFITSVIGVGTLPITWTKAIIHNFDKTRGIALGIALTGTGLFGFLAPAYTQWLIDSFGWRSTYIGIGVLPILLSFPLAFFLFHDPKEKAAMLTGNIIDVSKIPGLTLKAAFRDYRFYVILFSFLLLGALVSGIIGNAQFILMGKGYSAQSAASLFKGAGLIGLSVIFGRIIGGILVDKVWAPAIAFVFMSLPAIACIILMQSNASIGMNSLALVLVGLAAGVEYDLMAFLVSRYMGMKAYGKIYAFTYAAFGLGAGVSPVIYAKFKEASGSYEVILNIAAFGFILGAAMLLLLGRYRNFKGV